jgi:hypothetical protein
MDVATAPISKDHPLKSTWKGWPLERILFALGGTVVGMSVVLSAFVSVWFLLLTGFVAVNLLLFATVGSCGASVALRFFGVRSGVAR